MSRFIEGEARTQSLLFPERLDDWIEEDNPVRVIDAFVDELDAKELGFDGAVPADTGRPGYHPLTLLKIYVYGYLNRVQSSRRLEREAQRNVEVVWLTGRLMPDFKTIADFRKDNGPAIRKVCARFIELCRQMKLFTDAVVAIDGSKFKAVNNRDRNFTQQKIKSRMEHLEKSVKQYLDDLDRADREMREFHVVPFSSQALELRPRWPCSDSRQRNRGFKAFDRNKAPIASPGAAQYLGLWSDINPAPSGVASASRGVLAKGAPP